MAPYFQRKLVWRPIHKVDFIRTILYGYPFPEIFIAGGDLDIQEMKTNQFVVDGQQRLNSIKEFVDDQFSVDNRKYSELSDEEKEEFLKYEIVEIELDLKHNDERVIEVFKRLNKTFYSLTTIERLSTQYASSELMLLAKLMSKELRYHLEETEDESDQLDQNSIEFNPDIPPDFIEWANGIDVSKFQELILEHKVFTPYEASRQVHLMFCLNVLGTIKYGFFNRNLDERLIEDFTDSYESKEDLLIDLETIATKIIKMELDTTSLWFNKAALFSLIIAFYRNRHKLFKIKEDRIKIILEQFETSVPDDFKLAAKEGVNNKKERTIRDNRIQEIINRFK